VLTNALSEMTSWDITCVGTNSRHLGPALKDRPKSKVPSKLRVNRSNCATEGVRGFGNCGEDALVRGLRFGMIWAFLQ